METIKALSASMNDRLEIKIPGLLIIDTPGHEAFGNLCSADPIFATLRFLVMPI